MNFLSPLFLFLIVERHNAMSLINIVRYRKKWISFIFTREVSFLSATNICESCPSSRVLLHR
jgi:hypothetical protein